MRLDIQYLTACGFYGTGESTISVTRELSFESVLLSVNTRKLDISHDQNIVSDYYVTVDYYVNGGFTVRIIIDECALMNHDVIFRGS